MKKKHEEHENHERWLVSYADFITLLFAFFVVMYSVSSVNEGKYRILSESLSGSFSKTKPDSDLSIIDLPVTKSKPSVVQDPASAKKNAQSFLQAANAIAAAKVPEGVKVNTTERGLSIQIADDTLFGSGTSSINPDMQEYLDLITGLVRNLPNLITVEGHTDNQPIRTAQYPSNWDLSTARANALIRYFTEQHNLRSDRFSSTGFAGTRPLQSNSTSEGQAANRRVELIVLRGTDAEASQFNPFLP